MSGLKSERTIAGLVNRLFDSIDFELRNLDGDELAEKQRQIRVALVEVFEKLGVNQIVRNARARS